MNIQDKVAIITGGASGLGKGTAAELIAHGAKVALLDVNTEVGEAAAKELGPDASFFEVNVTDEKSVQDAIEKIMTAHGALHICVNCAGVGAAIKTAGSKGPYPLADFKRVIDINLVGSFNVLRLAAMEMLKNAPEAPSGERGLIVNTASAAAYDGQKGQAAYSASKGGIVGMTLPVARDLASYGIRVMAIAPGFFNTPMLNRRPPETVAKMAEDVPFPVRLGEPAEFGALVRHMAENAYLNADVIRLDGAARMPYTVPKR